MCAAVAAAAAAVAAASCTEDIAVAASDKGAQAHDETTMGVAVRVSLG